MKAAACLAALALCLFVGAARADVPCGSTVCPAHFLCLDRLGLGPACWKICTESVASTCDVGCCHQVSTPYTAWICVDDAECGDTDSDSAGSDSDYEDCSGDTEVCTSLELCTAFSDDSKLCAPICKSKDDCASECCMQTASGVSVCQPAGLDCTQSQGDEDHHSGGGHSWFGCQGQSSPIWWPLFFVAAWWRRRRHVA